VPPPRGITDVQPCPHHRCRTRCGTGVQVLGTRWPPISARQQALSWWRTYARATPTSSRSALTLRSGADHDPAEAFLRDEVGQRLLILRHRVGLLDDGRTLLM